MCCCCYCPPTASCTHTQVRVVCPGVFVAAIALASPGRLQPVRVCVDSADRASGVDPWTNSKHQVCGCMIGLQVISGLLVARRCVGVRLSSIGRCCSLLSRTKVPTPSPLSPSPSSRFAPLPTTLPNKGVQAHQPARHPGTPAL